MDTALAAAAAAATSFAQHVEVDDGVLATSRPLEAAQVDRVLVLVAEGLQRYCPHMAQRLERLRDRFTTQRAVGVADTLSSVLTLLAAHEQALAFFKGSIVQVLTEESLPLRAPAFEGGEDAAPLPTTVAAASAPAANDQAPEDSNGSRKDNGPSNGNDQDSDANNKESMARKRRSMSSSDDAETPTQARRLESPTMPMPSVTLRKRSMDSTYSTSSSSHDAVSTPTANSSSSSKKHAKRRMTAASSSFSSTTAMATASASPLPVKAREDPTLHPTYTVPTPWEELYYKPVRILNINAPGAKEEVQELRFNGTPFILEGFTNWMQFATDWVVPDTGALDTEAFLRGIHDVKVPVIEKNYEDTNPIKTHLPLGYYVRNYWEKGKADYYMHQWQFPLAPKAAKLLCYKCEEVPVMGDNLLLYWLDAVRGDNPLQYLFMGQRSTSSRMHQDPGGLGITIAPIVGTKRVTMLHRSAAKLDSVHDHVNFHDVDLNKSPSLAFIPAWRVDIQPGQLLYMPEGTLHACANITACLSYHRFHVDAVNMPGFLASFMAQDSPSINHAEILWNAAHDVMASIEENYYANHQQLDGSVYTLRKLDSLRALRHAARILSLEEAVPTEDSWDWQKLLEDIDHLLVRVDDTVRAAIATAAPETDSGGLTLSGPSGQAHPKAQGGRGTQPSSAKAQAMALAAAAAAAQRERDVSTHWDDLDLRVGDILGVQVFEKRNKARVLKIALDLELVQVHYVDWGSIYDEFVPVSSLFQRSTSRSTKRVPYRRAPKVHDPVLAKWGSNSGQLYNAIVLKVIRSNACLVHYLKYENDWDQWILPGHIFKKYSPK